MAFRSDRQRRAVMSNMFQVRYKSITPIFDTVKTKKLWVSEKEYQNIKQKEKFFKNKNYSIKKTGKTRPMNKLEKFRNL